MVQTSPPHVKLRMNLRSMIGIHQGRERLDVLLTVVLPLFLMLVSSYTNSWAFTGGNLSMTGASAVNTVIAMLKGLFVEALVFCFFKLVKILCSLPGWRNQVMALVPAMVGLFGVILSSGCGIAWVAKSGEMDFIIAAVSTYLPHGLTAVFQSGVGMFFPVSLAVLAVYDPKHMIKEHIESGSHLSVLALQVENAEHHQLMLRQAQQQANNDPQIRESYNQMARTNAQQAVESAKNGDYTFGLREIKTPSAPLPQSSVVRIAPPPAAYPPLPSPAGPYPVPQQPTLTGQFTNHFGPSGNTQQLNMPPVAAAPQKQGLFGWMNGH